MSCRVSVVTKSSPLLVGPSETTPAGTLRLTAMDSALASLPMTALFVYERPITQPAEAVRRALSRALVPYYPVAGRLAAGAHGGAAIACTGGGVAFAAALASCALQEAGLADARPAIPVEGLALSYAGQRAEDPSLLLMQVTEFSCGGFVVGVTWDHVVADGVGMAQFLQAVGELARGLALPDAVPPVRLDSSLPELPPPIISMTKSLVSSPHSEFPSTYITVPLSFINRIKAEFRRDNGNGDNGAAAPAPCSTFEVFTAAIWRCRARATIASAADKDAPTALAFTANVRKQAGAKDGYYGNVFTFGLAVATLRAVADGDVLDLVKLIRDAKARVPCTFADGAAYVAGEMGGRLQVMRPYDVLYVTSWWNLGFDDVDFGGGGAARVMGNMERKVVPGCILCGRKDKKDGVAAMALCVKEEHKEAFHAEIARLG
ncbi:hypothetical protein ACP70R_015234 [Stipagrostis hirtigluma subsp. patula]